MTPLRPILVALAALLPLAASAQTDLAAKVKVRLIAERSEIAPGAATSIALEEDIRSGWHTYWRNPGEAGAPTEIVWSLPPGWKVGPISWPYPKRLRLGPVTNYGYEGKPWLLMAVTAPANIDAGQAVTLRAHASWLACSSTLCIPEDAALSLPLVVSAHPSPPYATLAERFAQARAAIPVASPWPVRFREGRWLDLFIAAPQLAANAPGAAEFFPFAEGFVKDGADQALGAAESGIVLRLARAARAVSPKRLDGVLVLASRDGSVQALNIDALPGAVPQAHFDDQAGMGLALALFFAFLGGLILNLMPCVLPVLAMKALSVAAKAGVGRRDAAREGLAYGAGAVASFLALGLAVVLLRREGDAIGWGFQLQEPRVVAGFALLMFAVGLNLSGVFEWRSGLAAGEGLARKGGAAGAFFTGVLAVAVAAPCTAPFMAAAVGFALTQNSPLALGVFLFLGLGFGLPFVLVGLFPGSLRFLPRPGPWMIHFRQLLAFPMYGAAAWLVWVLAQEAGMRGLAAILTAMVALAFAAWAWTASRNAGRRWRFAGAICALLGLGLACAGAVSARAGSGGERAAVFAIGTALQAEPYSPARLAQLREEHRPVFVNATAAWCITCLVNEKVALSDHEVIREFAATHTAYLVADWTKRDSAVTALLSAYGRSGVPLYLLYRPGAAEAEVLPQILTPQALLAAADGR